MQKTVDHLHSQIKGFHSGNVSMAMVDSVKINYHGQPTPLKHVAIIGKQDRRISLQAHDPNMVDAIAKCLVDSGFDAYKFSKTQVVVNVPLPSGEQKQKTIKHIKKLGEEAKVAIRNLRKKFKKDIEDKHLQKVTDAKIGQINDLLSLKINEIGE